MSGQIYNFGKNAVTGLFPGSSCFTVPIFVHIRPAGSKRQVKTWFRAKIRSNFELWPFRVRSNLRIGKNLRYTLVPRFNVLHCAKLCQYWTVAFRVIPKTVHIRVNFFWVAELLHLWIGAASSVNRSSFLFILVNFE